MQLSYDSTFLEVLRNIPSFPNETVESIEKLLNSMILELYTLHGRAITLIANIMIKAAVINVAQDDFKRFCEAFLMFHEMVCGDIGNGGDKLIKNHIEGITKYILEELSIELIAVSRLVGIDLIIPKSLGFSVAVRLGGLGGSDSITVAGFISGTSEYPKMTQRMYDMLLFACKFVPTDKVASDIENMIIQLFLYEERISKYGKVTIDDMVKYIPERYAYPFNVVLFQVGR